ncbi:SAF domain-containing protein [Parasphingorhabdus pacifica]
MTNGRRMDGRLGPSPIGRLRMLPAIARSARMIALRRSAAVLLVLLAALLAWLSPARPAASPDDDVAVLVAARELDPGRVLGPEDLAVRHRPAGSVPEGALHTSADARGRVLSGAARRGEVLTDVRLAGSALTALTAGDGHASVPVRLADPSIADLLHPGRRVDLVTFDADSGGTSVLARWVPVLAVRPADETTDRGRLVVVGLPDARAAEVAATSLVHSVTVTLR